MPFPGIAADSDAGSCNAAKHGRGCSAVLPASTSTSKIRKQGMAAASATPNFEQVITICLGASLKLRGRQAVHVDKLVQ